VIAPSTSLLACCPLIGAQCSFPAVLLSGLLYQHHQCWLTKTEWKELSEWGSETKEEKKGILSG